MAIRRCPCCGLPARGFGTLASASSDDGLVHGIVGICMRCAVAEARLPRATRRKRMNRALDRALADPDKYLVKLFPDAGAARVAQAMIEHPDHAGAMLVGLGWWDAGTDPVGLTRSDDHGSG